MSNSYAIELENLSKTFGRRRKKVQAVQEVNLAINTGQVYGFLGPNGAGKSTTIRMMMGLIRPSQGQVKLFGTPVGHALTILQKRVGALVEGAMFYDFLTGRRNLEVIARTAGVYDAARIEQLLAQVNMSDRADRFVKGYSTGMKQRLGLAAALLSDPDLVILDEPTNGLDPAGIQEMRYFIRELVEEQGKTVFLSSHMLSEVEQVCDRVAIIHNGRVLREGKVADLLDEQFQIRLVAEPLARATAVLHPHWPTSENDNHLRVTCQRDDIPHIVRQLVENEVAIYEIQPQRQSLEDFFLKVTQNSEPSV